MRPPPAEDIESIGQEKGIAQKTPSKSVYSTSKKGKREDHPMQSASSSEAEMEKLKKKLFSSSMISNGNNVPTNNADLRYDGAGGDYSFNLGEFNEFKVPPPPTAFVNKKSPQLKLSTKIIPIGTRNGGTKTIKQMKQTVKHAVKTVNSQQPSKFQANLKKVTRIPVQKSKSTESLKIASKSEDETKNDKLMEEVDPEVGKLYEISRRLGKGAYGVVWEAIEKSTGRKVALKKIYEAFRNTTDSQRTYREVVLLKAFGHHPNIISVIGGHSAINCMDLYLVFPLLKFDLYKVIERNPKLLTEASTKKVAYQLVLALNYLHSAEIIHRDLKPANILLDSELNVKLADLGLARSMPTEFCKNEGDNRLSHDFDPELTDYVATRWYRPPEIIISSRTYTKSMDMWAFGCILGEMLLKKVVFAGDSASHQLELIMQTINPPSINQIEELCRSIDHRNVDIISKALEERGPSVSEIFFNFDCSTVDIIERLLRFLPAHRLSVEGVLNHPYFYRVGDPYKELKAPGPFRPILDDSAKLEIIDYQNALNDMVDRKQVISDPHPFVVGQNYQKHGDEVDEFDDSSSTTTDTEISNDGDRGFDITKVNFVPEQQQTQRHQIYQDFSSNEEDDNENFEAYDKDYQFRPPSEIQALSNFNFPDPNGYLDFEDNIDVEQFDLEPIPAPQPFREPPQTSSIQPLINTSSTSFPATKSVSDSATNVQKGFNFNKTGAERRDGSGSTNLSILTMPSSKRDEEEKPEAFKKFELLCHKHDVNIEDYGTDLCWKSGNIKTPLKTDNVAISKKNERTLHSQSSDENHFEYLPQSTFQKATGKPMTPVINRKGQTNPPSSPSYQEFGGCGDILGEDFNNDCDYDEDYHRIQDTVAKNTDEGFVNPYKPKGRKTSSTPPSYNIHQSAQFDNDDDCDDEDYDNDFSHRKHEQNTLRNSKPKNPSSGSGDSRMESFPQISDFKMRGSSYSPNPSHLLKGTKSFNDPSPQGNRRLKDLFPSKEAIQTRIRQIETRVKGKTFISQSQKSQSLDSFNYGKSKHSSFPTDGIIMVNGRNKVQNSTRGSSMQNRVYDERERVPTDFAKSKFSFTPYSRVELVEVAPQPQRPFGGRAYNKNFTGPSFRRNPTRIRPNSFSDTELNLANKAGHNRVMGGSGPGGGNLPSRQSHGPSSYFPSASRQRFQPSREPRNKMSHASNNNSSGFTSAMHQMPVTPRYNNAGQRMSSNFRNDDIQPQHRNKSNTTSKYSTIASRMSSTTMSEFDKPGSSTIRASELYTLKNSFRGTTNGLERRNR